MKSYSNLCVSVCVYLNSTGLRAGSVGLMVMGGAGSIGGRKEADSRGERGLAPVGLAPGGDGEGDSASVRGDAEVCKREQSVGKVFSKFEH